MKKLILLLLFLAANFKIQAQQPPIIDREIFFGNPEIAAGQLSPDGKWISFMKENNGILNIWVKKYDEPFEKAKPLTKAERPLAGYFWTYDSKYILYVKDNKGDENYHIYAVNPSDELLPETGVPAFKDLTNREKVNAQIYAVSKLNPDILWVGLNDRDAAWHDLYKLEISTGKLTLLVENNNRYTNWQFDWNENVRLAERSDDNGFSQILKKKDDNTFEKIYETNLQERAYVAGWNIDNTKFYLVSNKGNVNLSTLYLKDFKTLVETKVESDPLNKVDFGGLMLDDNTHKEIYTNYTYDKGKYYWKDKNWEKIFKILQAKLPNREIDFSSTTKDYKKLLITAYSDTKVAEAYVYDVSADKLIFQYTPRPKLKAIEASLSPMQAISYKSSDGLTIPAYLTLPKGKGNKNLSVVVLVHGGPKGPRDEWGYNSYAQILANRGYAVLQPNFRASGGYGKAFLNAGDKQWGRKMQDDITWGVKHLIATGVANKDKVAIMGGSYGGYATLAGLTFTPNVYACGVDIVGPSNINTLLESVPAYWEAFRKSLYEMTGDPTTEEGKKLIYNASPINFVDKITKPLLIIQGANDPRVKQAESDQIVEAMYKTNKPVEYILADDEGHGFRKPVNNMAMWAAAEKFLATYLGGRYQESMTPEVAKRLQEIRQEVSKVKYVPKTKIASEALPALTGTLTEGSSNYDVKIAVQGKEFAMESVRTVKKEGENYLVDEISKSSIMGEMKTSSKITVKGLKTISKIVNQQGQTISVILNNNKINFTGMGQNKDIDVKENCLLDGAGFDMILARLPLKEGLTQNLDFFDEMTQKIITKKMTVTNGENGNFKLTLVNVDNDKDTTEYIINPTKGLAEKITQIVPMMGNAVVTITLK